MLDGDTGAKELSLNFMQSIETVYYDQKLDMIVFLWRDKNGTWFEYELSGFCAKSETMVSAKINDLFFLGLVD